VNLKRTLVATGGARASHLQLRHGRARVRPARPARQRGEAARGHKAGVARAKQRGGRAAERPPRGVQAQELLQQRAQVLRRDVRVARRELQWQWGCVSMCVRKRQPRAARRASA
jgi:hypothetical protein